MKLVKARGSFLQTAIQQCLFDSVINVQRWESWKPYKNFTI